MTAITALKNSFQRSYDNDDPDTISILGQKVSYYIDGDSKVPTYFRYICTYSLLLIVLGCTETFGMAIYTELRRQLNVTTSTIALIFSCKSIAFAIGAMICAYILDQFIETHRYISCFIILQSAAIFLIPFTNNLSMAYILFIVIGYTMGSVFVCFPVYIFRLYPHRKTKILSLYLLLSIYLPAKIMTPLLIQFAISSFNDYQSPLYLISVLSLLSGITILSVVTPQHDDLRTIKDDIQRSDDMRHSQKQNENQNRNSNIDALDDDNRISNGYHLYSGNHHEIHQELPIGEVVEAAHSGDPAMTNSNSLGLISDDRTDPDHHTESDLNNSNSMEINHENYEPNPYPILSRTSNAGSVLPQIIDSVHGVHQSEMYLESPTEIEDISNQISFLLRNDPIHVRYQNTIIVLIALMYLLFSATQSGLLFFITTFCEDYLNVDISNGRFMISSYYAGQLVYRLIVILIVGTGNSSSTSSWNKPNVTLTVGFIAGAVVALVFVLSSSDLIAVYIVYGVSGIIGGGIIPDLYMWSESVRPLSGMVSCMHIIGYSGGDALGVFVIGELFAILGPEILPATTLIANLIGFAIAVGAVFLFSKYKHHRSNILVSFPRINPKTAQQYTTKVMGLLAVETQAERNVLILSISFLLIFSGWSASFAFATSQNGEIGAFSVGLIFITISISNLIIVPFLNAASPRIVMFFSSITYLLFIASNIILDPIQYLYDRVVLYILSVILGFGATSILISQSLFVNQCASIYEHDKGLPPNSKLGYFNGIFLMFFFVNRLCGYLISAVLFALRYEENTVFSILSILCAFGSMGLLMISEDADSKGFESFDHESLKSFDKNDKLHPESETLIDQKLKSESFNSTDSSHSTPTSISSSIIDLRSSISTITSMWISSDFLSIAGLTLFSGVDMQFNAGEFPLFFSSKSTKFFMLALSGFSASASSFVLGKLSDSIMSRVKILRVGFACKLIMYLVLLWNVEPLWTLYTSGDSGNSDIEEENENMIMCTLAVCAILMGIGDGCLLGQEPAIYVIVFGNKAEVFANMRVWKGLAAAVAYFLHPVLTLQQKLLINLALVILGFIPLNICSIRDRLY